MGVLVEDGSTGGCLDLISGPKHVTLCFLENEGYQKNDFMHALLIQPAALGNADQSRA